jgi:hypothetical protein
MTFQIIFASGIAACFSEEDPCPRFGMFTRVNHNEFTCETLPLKLPEVNHPLTFPA